MISGKTILSFLSSVLTLLQQEGLTTFATLASSSSTARFPEALASQMLDDRIHVCPIDRTEAHAECLFVYPLFRHRHVVRPVEVGDDTVGEGRVGVVVLVYQIVQHIERLELIVNSRPSRF